MTPQEPPSSHVPTITPLEKLVCGVTGSSVTGDLATVDGRVSVTVSVAVAVTVSAWMLVIGTVWLCGGGIGAEPPDASRIRTNSPARVAGISSHQLLLLKPAPVADKCGDGVDCDGGGGPVIDGGGGGGGHTIFVLSVDAVVIA